MEPREAQDEGVLHVGLEDHEGYLLDVRAEGDLDRWGSGIDESGSGAVSEGNRDRLRKWNRFEVELRGECGVHETVVGSAVEKQDLVELLCAKVKDCRQKNFTRSWGGRRGV
jgi:hypothetical protein